MSNEIKLIGYTAGATVAAVILDNDLLQVGSSIAMSEVGAGDYMASIPGSVPLGRYSVKVLDGVTIIGTAAFDWDGNDEVDFGTLYRHPLDWTTISANTTASTLLALIDAPRAARQADKHIAELLNNNRADIVRPLTAKVC